MCQMKHVYIILQLKRKRIGQLQNTVSELKRCEETFKFEIYLQMKQKGEL